MPSPMLASVMPSCATAMYLSLPVGRSTTFSNHRAALLPPSASVARRLRRELTSANSAATNTPFATARQKITRIGTTTVAIIWRRPEG